MPFGPRPAPTPAPRPTVVVDEHGWDATEFLSLKFWMVVLFWPLALVLALTNHVQRRPARARFWLVMAGVGFVVHSAIALALFFTAAPGPR